MIPFSLSKNRYLLWAASLLCVQLLSGVALTWAQSTPQSTKNEGRQFVFDQSQSSISFVASSTLHPVKGKAKSFSGKITLPSLSDPSTGNVALVIEASSLDTDHEGRDKVMRDSCLETGRFPTVQFKSLEVLGEPKSYSLGQTGKAEIQGLLDLHGVQKKIMIPVEYRLTDQAVLVNGKTIVKMSEFKIPEPKFLFLRVKDDIEIAFSIQAFPQ
jgi:polyisoprenoid-binding protein YceI